MVARCHSRRHPGWRNFGSRGITVCRSWREDFWAFVADVGVKPEGHVLRIKDKSQGFYGPGNWEWAKKDRHTICRGTLKSRLLTGWDPKLAASTPPKGLTGLECTILATGVITGKEVKKAKIFSGSLRECWKQAWKLFLGGLRRKEACKLDIVDRKSILAKVVF